MLNNRWIRCRNLLWIGVIGAGLLSAEAARAYCLKPDTEGNPTLWKLAPGETLKFRLSREVPDGNPGNFTGAIGSALGYWGNADCATFTLEAGDKLEASDRWPGPDGFINVYWFDSSTGYPGDTRGHFVTDVKYAAGGEIVRASIAINGFSGLPWTDTSGTPTPRSKSLDLYSEMLYIVGQVVGLAESDINDRSKTALVRRQVAYELGTILDLDMKASDNDDQQGIQKLYFDTAQPGCEQPKGPGTCDHVGQVNDAGLIYPDVGVGTVDSGGGSGSDDAGSGSNGGKDAGGKDAGVSGNPDTATNQNNTTKPKDSGGCSMLSLSATSTSLLLAALLAMMVARRRRRERARA